MKVLHFDCISGISGDMTIGAFLDAGMDFSHLAAQLSKLGLDGYSLKREKVIKNGLSATKFNVVDSGGNVFGHAPMFAHCKKTHDHGHHGHDHHHDHDHDHDHHHDHHHDQSGSGAEGAHRGIREIRDMINGSGIADRAKKIAVAIFEDIADAESRMHGIAPEKVLFHEVGALDSIVDIVGTAVCVDHFGVEECTVSSLPVSFGYIKFSHGKWPNPAPAALELMKGFDLRHLDVGAELVTPTGAAILRVLCKRSAPLPAMNLAAIGYGAGYHDFDHPNVLRLLIGESRGGRTAPADAAVSAIASEIGCGADEVDVITANIDDMPPEHFETVVEKLMEAGALDAAVTPVLMKKGRPAYQISVICGRPKTPSVAARLFRTSTTIGMRVETRSRLVLERRTVKIQTAHGEVAFKAAYLAGEKLHSKPEFEDLKKYASGRGISTLEASAELARLFADAAV